MAVSYKLHSAQGNPINIRSPNTTQQHNASRVPNLRCPHCLHMGAFTPVVQNDLVIQHMEMRGQAPFNTGVSTVGIRVCPNSDCAGIVLVIIDANGKVIALPNEVLDFDPANIPPSIAGSLEEAVKCHSAQCYKAAALMVRRVLEELCEDRKASGNNLQERIAALSNLIVIPRALIEAADHLRLLGNDAAHIEAKTYQSIGEPEVRIAINLTKELLKAAYQYEGLLNEFDCVAKGDALNSKLTSLDELRRCFMATAPNPPQPRASPPEPPSSSF